MSGIARVWRPAFRPDLALLATHRRGAGDPTYRIVGQRHWRGIRTPEGPATLAVHLTGTDVYAESWGEGSEWALASLPALLGAEDRPEEFRPQEPLLEALVDRLGVPRLGRNGLVMESLVPSIIEQKVTGQEAFGGFRVLVQRFGERAPGPGVDHRLRIQPTPEQLTRIPSWEWLKLQIDPARSKAVIVAARVAASLERTASLQGDEVERRLTSLPGIGEWTAAEVRQRAHGDPDAVSFGDYHVAKDLGWGLTGTPWDDEQLRAYLEPHRPHRGRVVALLYRAHGHRPRRGPRLAPRTHLPM